MRQVDESEVIDVGEADWWDVVKSMPAKAVTGTARVGAGAETLISDIISGLGDPFGAGTALKEYGASDRQLADYFSEQVNNQLGLQQGSFKRTVSDLGSAVLPMAMMGFASGPLAGAFGAAAQGGLDIYGQRSDRGVSPLRNALTTAADVAVDTGAGLITFGKAFNPNNKLGRAIAEANMINLPITAAQIPTKNKLQEFATGEATPEDEYNRDWWNTMLSSPIMATAGAAGAWTGAKYHQRQANKWADKILEGLPTVNPKDVATANDAISSKKGKLTSKDITDIREAIVGRKIKFDEADRAAVQRAFKARSGQSEDAPSTVNILGPEEAAALEQAGISIPEFIKAQESQFGPMARAFDPVPDIFDAESEASAQRLGDRALELLDKGGAFLPPEEKLIKGARELLNRFRTEPKPFKLEQAEADAIRTAFRNPPNFELVGQPYEGSNAPARVGIDPNVMIEGAEGSFPQPEPTPVKKAAQKVAKQSAIAQQLSPDMTIQGYLDTAEGRIAPQEPVVPPQAPEITPEGQQAIARPMPEAPAAAQPEPIIAPVEAPKPLDLDVTAKAPESGLTEIPNTHAPKVAETLKAPAKPKGRKPKAQKVVEQPTQEMQGPTSDVPPDAEMPSVFMPESLNPRENAAGARALLEKAQANGEPAYFDGYQVKTPRGYFDPITGKMTQKLSGSKEMTDKVVREAHTAMKLSDKLTYGYNKVAEDMVRATVEADANAAAKAKAKQAAEEQQRQRMLADREAIKQETQDLYKAAKFKKSKIEMATVGAERRQIEGYEHEGWFISKIGGTSKGYSITHKESGKQAGTRSNLQDAKLLVARLAKEVPAVEITREMAAMGDKKPKEMPPFFRKAADIIQDVYHSFSKLDNEKGGQLFSSDLASGTKQIIDNLSPRKWARSVQEFFTPEGIDSAKENLTKMEMFLGGRIGTMKHGDHNKVGTQAWATANFRRLAIFPQTLAEKSPLFRDLIYRPALKLQGLIHTTSAELYESIKPYYKLSEESRTKVNALFIKSRLEGTLFDERPEVLAKAGYSPDEIAAIRAVRSTMKKSLLILKEALIAAKKGRHSSPEAEALYNMKVENFINTIAASNYVPFSRFGDRYVIGRDANGKVRWFSLHDTKAGMFKKYNEMRENPEFSHLKFDKGMLDKPSKEAYSELPPDMIGLSSVDPEFQNMLKEAGRPIQGFGEHFVTADLTPGYSVDLGRAMARYLQGVANFSAHKIVGAEFEAGLKKIESMGEHNKQRENRLHEYSSRYVDYMQSASPEAQQWRQMMSMYMLGLNPKPALLNLSQSLTMTYPLLANHTDNPGKEWRRALGMAKDRIFNPKKFAKQNPELAKALDAAFKDGTTSEQQARELGGIASGEANNLALSEASMYMFAKTEMLLRLHAFIARWNTAGNIKNPSDRLTAAEDFVRQTQGDYSKANRPEMYRGRKAALGQFQMFTGFILRAMRNNATNLPVISRIVGAMGALGGMATMPFLRELQSGLKSMGYDPERDSRELIQGTLADIMLPAVKGGYLSKGTAEKIGSKVADVAQYGLPALIGKNISESIAYSNLVPNVETGPAAAIARTIGGVPVGMAQRGLKALNLWLEKGNPQRAAETLLPEFLRNISVAARAREEAGFPKGSKRGWTSPDGTLLVENPSWDDIAARLIGIQPLDMTKAYSKQHSLDIIKKDAIDNQNVNIRLAQAIINKDRDATKEIMDEIKEWNKSHPAHMRIEPNVDSIMSIITDRISGDFAAIRNAPKKARPEIMRNIDIWKGLPR